MNLEKTIQKIINFRNERNWKQFHNAKDLSISISLEANELLECFQWKDSEEAVNSSFKDIVDELADICIYTFLLAHDLNINIEDAIADKLKKNAIKYPISKAYGSKEKYSNL